MEYDFRQIEEKWQRTWKQTGAYTVSNDSDKPKFYVLDMFPYPSGAGLHVGHPLGYIASDIFSRYKRLKGFNVLHPMGFDSFGLPAEQYAIETGQHPSDTTEKNIQRYHQQLDNIGFCYDWSREVRTSDPSYYKWTQYIFLQLFDSWYNRTLQKAERIEVLTAIFEKEGNANHPTPGNKDFAFTAGKWASYNEKTRLNTLMQYRLAYLAYGEVNWCEALGTVLANDEVVNGVSERGSHPVIKKKLHQWYLRITEYADRLLQGLEQVDFSDAMKDMQRNWIGRSEGAEINFTLTPASPRRGEGPEKHPDEGFNDLTPSPSPEERGANELPSSVGPTSTENKNRTPGYITNTVDQWRATTAFAKLNRKTPTEAEDILWQELRNRKVHGFKFRRQQPIAGFIPDFVCLDKKLIVEIDGGYHNEDDQRAYDAARERWLAEHGYTITRVTNDEVKNDLENVILKLGKALSFGEGLSEVKRGEQQLKSNQPVQEESAENQRSNRITNDHTGENDDQRQAADGPSPLRGEAGVRVYTTRPDTIFGVDFMVLAPEHELVKQITTAHQQKEIDDYLNYVQTRSERERLAEVKSITGAFTGAYVSNPFDGREIPIWISEYVLAGYGTGAIMAVPCGDQRDFNFAKHFNIPITNIIGNAYNGQEANPTKDATLQNAGFMDGLVMRDAMPVAIDKIEALGIGKRQVNYRMRDAGFSRQRYWGEPFPIVYKDGTPYPLIESDLPVELPYVDSYGPGPEGEGPLANLKDWVLLPSPVPGEGPGMRETNTMPGYAGSSWYFLRYMDPQNQKTFVDRKAADYWGQVDLYIGGTEHAVGHLLYSRLWTKVLCDLGYIGFDEPYKKLVNQGMIQGSSRFVYKLVVKKSNEDRDQIKQRVISQIFYSLSYYLEFKQGRLKDDDLMVLLNQVSGGKVYNLIPRNENFSIDIVPIHVDVKYFDGVELNIEGFRKSKSEFTEAIFVREKDGKYLSGAEVEKMSKRYYNVVNPDDIVERYGADTFRMYEMFLGPIEQSKPWDTKGIEGVHRFLRKFWRLYVDEAKGLIVTSEEPTPAELKVLHRTIKKIEDDTGRFSFNTAVSAFMITANDLADLKCHKRAILEPLLILITPYAPHIAEELYQLLRASSSLSPGEGRGDVKTPDGRGEVSILNATYPTLQEKYLVESSKEYPLSINGKVRSSLTLPLDMPQQEVEAQVLENDVVQKWLEGKVPKKIIFVKGKMINVVI